VHRPSNQSDRLSLGQSRGAHLGEQRSSTAKAEQAKQHQVSSSAGEHIQYLIQV
jgi:hypothetical protein